MPRPNLGQCSAELNYSSHRYNGIRKAASDYQETPLMLADLHAATTRLRRGKTAPAYPGLSKMLECRIQDAAGSLSIPAVQSVDVENRRHDEH